MKKCICCGTVSASNNDNMCGNCGSRLEEVPSLQCRNCGAELPADRIFCEKCGTELNSYNNYDDDFQDSYREDVYLHDRTYIDKGHDKKSPVAAILLAAILVVLITIVIYLIFVLNNSGNDTSDNASTTTQEETHNETSSFSDYDPDNDDWYRLRKTNGNSYTQAGAYKTTEAALHFAEIYAPQGYILYDKDFNPVDLTSYGIYYK